jgi:hypothetical protein
VYEGGKKQTESVKHGGGGRGRREIKVVNSN